jgi:hypothetical protein
MAVKQFLTIGYFRMGWGATPGPGKAVHSTPIGQKEISSLRTKAVNYLTTPNSTRTYKELSRLRKMLPSISESPESLDYSEWTDLLQQLPLFPPAAHPPPSLFPLLSPILQQKLGFLSLGRGSGWPGALTWLEPALSYKVNERLKSSNRQAGLQERFKGYRRFDQEMVRNPRTLSRPF